MRWTALREGSDDEPSPSARSGHSATLVGDYVVVFGGTQGKNFRGDTVVLDVRDVNLSDEHASRRPLWFRPEPCMVNTPGPRAFHSAVAIGTDLYIMCGRTGRTQHGDVWVLDTTTWQWSSLDLRFPHSNNTRVTPRDFGVATKTPQGNNLLLFGGFDGTKWLNDLHVLELNTGSWRCVTINSIAPSPRSGHAGDVLDKRRVLVFGGQGSNGQLCGDLWTLRDPDRDEALDAADALLNSIDMSNRTSGGSEKTPKKENENENSSSPAWTRLHLKGPVPSPRTGHSVTRVGSKVLIFGGHGDDGWLVKQHVYYDDLFVVDMEVGRWRKLDGGNNLSQNKPTPSPRAFHTVTVVGKKVLLIGGFSGEKNGTTGGALADAWWGEFGEEDDGKDEHSVSHSGSQSISNNPFTVGSPPTGAPLENVVGGVGRLLGSGLGAVVGMAARGVGGVHGFQGSGDVAGTSAGRQPPSPSKAKEKAVDKTTLLASVLSSVERISFDDNSYPEVGDETRRHFFASCDPDDLRVGDLKHALAMYRRTVANQGLGMPIGLGMSDDDGNHRAFSQTKEGHHSMNRGRFMHVSPDRMRMQDVPAMLTELQGALIAEA